MPSSCSSYELTGGTARAGEHLRQSQEHEAGADRHEGEKKRSPLERARDTWIWESLSILWALLCLAAIIIILASVSGKAVSTWHLPISPNAFVAIFSTLTKAALMTAIPACISQLKWVHFAGSPRPLIDMDRFDLASRGSFGALVFLYDLILGTARSGASALASAGCAITIIVLALEPFTQQIISYRERMVELQKGAGEATLVVATGYDTGTDTLSGTSTPDTIDDLMQGALLAGIFSQPIDPRAYETCSSSNCTWPATTSLGICSSCQNVTAESGPKCDENDKGVNVENWSCDYTTPSGISLRATTGPAPSASRFYTMLNATGIPSPLIFGADIGPQFGFLARFGILRIGSPDDTATAFPDSGRVDECYLFWCKSTYTPTSTFANGSRFVNTSTEPLYYDQMFDRHYATLIDEKNTTSYPINLADAAGAGNMLEKLFTTSLGSELTQVSQDENFSIAKLLYKTPNITSLFDHMALSMTTRLRSGGNTSQVSGQAWHNETYIHVEWAWFTLPAVLAVSAIIILVFTAVMSKHRGPGLWRASVLPYMFVGRDWGVDDILISGASKEGVSQMERIAESQRVRCAP